MIFNSFSFIFAFLPITLIGYFFLSRKSTQWAAVWLTLASLLFYGWWDYHYLPLLLASILFNYWTGWRIAHAIQPSRKRWLMAVDGCQNPPISGCKTQLTLPRIIFPT